MSYVESLLSRILLLWFVEVVLFKQLFIAIALPRLVLEKKRLAPTAAPLARVRRPSA